MSAAAPEPTPKPSPGLEAVDLTRHPHVRRRLEQVLAVTGDPQPVGDVALMTPGSPLAARSDAEQAARRAEHARRAERVRAALAAGDSLESLGLMEGGLEQVLHERGLA
jgi:hypothetical protein